jgi:hypothetical protein
MAYCRQVRSVFERVALDKDPRTAVPPKYLWFDNQDGLDEWFDQRKK